MALIKYTKGLIISNRTGIIWMMMELVERLGKNLVKFLIQAGLLWLIVSPIFVRLEERLPFFVAVLLTYFVSAYVILPSLVQFLMLVTRQGRIPRFTKSRDGLTVDPVNLILLGTIDQLETVFKKIGWSKADEISLKTAVKMIDRFVRNKPYKTAPFSNLFLFGRKQDIGFQKEIGDSPRKRHHIRFWGTDENKVVDPFDVNYWTKKQEFDHNKSMMWIGAGSMDVGFGLTRLTYKISHRIDHNVDKERDFIIKELKQQNSIGRVDYYKPGVFRVGKYTSDGRIAVAKIKLGV